MALTQGEILDLIKREMGITPEEERNSVLVDPEISRLSSEGSIKEKFVALTSWSNSLSDIFNIPKIIRLENFFEITKKNYWIFLEIENSSREFMFLVDRKAYLISSSGSIIEYPPYKSSDDTYSNTLLEGITVSGHFYASDLLYFKSLNYKSENLDVRMKRLNELKKNVDLVPFYSSTSFYEKLRLAMDNKEWSTVIFKPVIDPYKNTKTFIWKPRSSLTINFMMTLQLHTFDQYIPNVVKKEINSGDENEFIPFRGSETIPYSDLVSSQQDLKYKVAKCSWDDATENFIPVEIKKRNDADSILSAEHTWYNIHYSVTNETMRGLSAQIPIKIIQKIVSRLLDGMNTMQKFSDIIGIKIDEEFQLPRFEFPVADIYLTDSLKKIFPMYGNEGPKSIIFLGIDGIKLDKKFKQIRDIHKMKETEGVLWKTPVFIIEQISRYKIHFVLNIGDKRYSELDMPLTYPEKFPDNRYRLKETFSPYYGYEMILSPQQLEFLNLFTISVYELYT